MRRELKAVIFDLDGVIADTAKLHYLAWKKLASEIGIDLKEEFNDKLRGVGRMESLGLILSLSDKSYSDMGERELANRKNRYYLDLIENITPDDMLPGAIDCFKMLGGKKIKMVLASMSKNAMDVIKRLKIEGYFDYVISGMDILKSKPDPEIFIKSARGIKASTKNCVGVEDAVAGILAINSCGMFSVGVGKKEVLNMADVCIKDLSEFDIDKIREIGGFV
jgi:beta-phosphoglucomutase